MDAALPLKGVPAMNTDTRAADLLEAAVHARAFARSQESLELRKSFFALASKWEAEAQVLEKEDD